MTNGTAQITQTDDMITLNYMTQGSFLVGTQVFGNSRQGWNAALRFCRERGLRVKA